MNSADYKKLNRISTIINKLHELSRGEGGGPKATPLSPWELEALRNARVIIREVEASYRERSIRNR